EGHQRSGCRRYRPARTVGADWNACRRQGLPCDRLAIEDDRSVPDFDSVAWQADHAFDQVRIFAWMAEDHDIAALRQRAQYSSAESRDAKGEAVARETIGPFRHDEIIADVEGWQHRPGR